MTRRWRSGQRVGGGGGVVGGASAESQVERKRTKGRRRWRDRGEGGRALIPTPLLSHNDAVHSSEALQAARWSDGSRTNRFQRGSERQKQRERGGGGGTVTLTDRALVQTVDISDFALTAECLSPPTNND